MKSELKRARALVIVPSPALFRTVSLIFKHIWFSETCNIYIYILCIVAVVLLQAESEAVIIPMATTAEIAIRERFIIVRKFCFISSFRLKCYTLINYMKSIIPPAEALLLPLLSCRSEGRRWKSESSAADFLLPAAQNSRLFR